MGRNWQPKSKAICSECGWTGIRVRKSVHTKPCPQCKTRGSVAQIIMNLGHQGRKPRGGGAWHHVQITRILKANIY